MKSESPAILETHGGAGHIFKKVYSNVTAGVVFETDEEKADILAQQRPTWSVYHANCEEALAAGAGSHLRFDVVDVDPYGQPFPAIEGYLTSSREFPDRWFLVVNDGLRQAVKLRKSWAIESLQEIVLDFGNDLYKDYLQVAKEKIRRLAAAAGFELASWTGYHCGANHDMTHYLAELRRA